MIQIRRYDSLLMKLYRIACLLVILVLAGCQLQPVEPAPAERAEPVESRNGIFDGFCGEVDRAPIVGAEIVELNPMRDINGMTAMVAAKLLKELAAKLLTS